METCPKCKTDLESSAEECPRCGVVVAKFVPRAERQVWQASAAGKQYSANFDTFRQWIAEGRFAPTDHVLPPRGKWTPSQDVPGLLITITTGGLDTPYEPIDAIFAIGSHTYGGLFGGGADPNLAFDGVKQQLRRVCYARGGDAVIHCDFEYRVAVSNALIGTNQIVEIFAYGTAVRVKKISSES